MLELIREIVALQKQMHDEHMAIMRQFMKSFQVDSDPTLRMNGDELREKAAREEMLAAAGYPSMGSQHEQVQWLVDNLGNLE